MKSMRYLLPLVVSGFVLAGMPAEGVVVGNPCESSGQGRVALALESERFQDRFLGDAVRSQRFLGRVAYGLTGHIDAFAKAGTGALRISPGQGSGKAEFSGDGQLALGGGLRVETGKSALFGESRFFAVLQGLQFRSEGRSLRKQSHKDWTWDERLDMLYSWREIGVAVGLKRPFPKACVYGGFALTRISGWVEREQFVLSEGTSFKVGSGWEKFTEGPGAGIFLGLDYYLPGTVRFSVECQLNGRRDGSVLIGINERMD